MYRTKDGTAIQEADVGYDIHIPVAVTAGEFISTLVLGTADNSMGPFAGRYKCAFIFTADTAEYSSEGVVDVRLVNIIPAATPASPHVSFDSAEQTIACTLSQTDSASFEVKWSLGRDAINSGFTTTGLVSTLTLTDLTKANNGLYTCQFVFMDTNSPQAITSLSFSIMKMSPKVIYSTYGTGVTITLTCEVASLVFVNLVFVESAKNFLGTTPIFADSKTTLTHEIAVTSYTATDKIYSCKNEATGDVAQETTTHKILHMTATLNAETRENKGETVSLTCATDWNGVIKMPLIKWYKGDVPIFLEQTATGDKSTTQSIQEVKINDKSDGVTFKCAITYYELVEGGAYESITNIIMNSKLTRI